MVKRAIAECDLAGPVRDFLAAQGYTVRSEVKDCDMVAVLGDELIVVELKRGFTIDLLLQATDRQRATDSVYVAIPGSGERRERFSKRWQSMERLLKRLELGLILVAFPPDPDTPPTVDLCFHPVRDPRPRQKPKQRRAILREVAGRSGDYNVGGSYRRPLLTAYREQAIGIALCLQEHGPLSPAALRTFGCGAKTARILQTNVYGWFERQERGLYAVRPTVCDYIGSTWPAFGQEVVVRSA